jgi:hypothetical protein
MRYDSIARNRQISIYIFSRGAANQRNNAYSILGVLQCPHEICKRINLLQRVLF